MRLSTQEMNLSASSKGLTAHTSDQVKIVKLALEENENTPLTHCVIVTHNIFLYKGATHERIKNCSTLLSSNGCAFAS